MLTCVILHVDSVILHVDSVILPGLCSFTDDTWFVPPGKRRASGYLPGCNKVVRPPYQSLP